jgi:OPA family sugar phosphate sensor protein UhpC-like MFS transporter
MPIPSRLVLALAALGSLAHAADEDANLKHFRDIAETRGYSLGQAGTMLMISTLAGIGGAIGYGFISDKLFAARRPPANLIFGVLELLGLWMIFYGPNNVVVLTAGMVLFGMGMTALVTSLGGLFATDICPKRVAGAAMGLIGVFSYLGAAIQEQVSGALIEKGMIVTNGVRTYDFGPAITFWIGSSVVSLVLATALWRAKLRD